MYFPVFHVNRQGYISEITCSIIRQGCRRAAREKSFFIDPGYKVIKKPGIAGDGRGEWVAFSGRKYRFYFDIDLLGSASAGID